MRRSLVLVALTLLPTLARAQDAGPSPEPLPQPITDFERVTGLDGQALMVGYGAAYGLYVGGSLGAVIGGDEAIAASTLLGGAAGAGTILLAGPADPTPDQGMLMASSTTFGSYTGIQLARAFIPVGDEAETDRILSAGVLGSMAGTGVGIALLPHAPDAGLMWRTDVAAVIGWQTAAGAADMAGLEVDGDRQLRAPLALGGAYGYAGTSYLLGRYAGVKPDGLQLATSLGHGAWIGGWSPYLFSEQPTDEQRLGGMRLGLGAGYLVATTMSPLVDSSPRSAGLQLVGAAAGNALGAGIPLAIGLDEQHGSRAFVGPMIGAGIAGQVLGGVAAPVFEPSSDDLVMMTALGAWTGYQAIGWGYYGQHLFGTPSRATGYALSTAGSGTLLALGLVPVVEMSPAESVMMTTAGGWGTWYGAWGGHLLHLSPSDHWLLTLGAGNAALLGSAALLASPVDPDWRSVGLVNGLALAGGASGALFGVVGSPKLDVIASSGLAGTTVGLGAGIAMAIADGGGGDSDLALPTVRLGRTPWQPSVAVAPWTAEDGTPGAYFELSLRERQAAAPAPFAGTMLIDVCKGRC